jgi:GDP-4-dehydro-6-deoxy-D-mannose reductase
MNKILVTGSDGFIGNNLIPKLQRKKYFIIEKCLDDGDISEQSTWDAFPPADLVIHLAARTFVPDSWLESYEYIRCNFLGTIAALEYCHKHDAKLVFLSSYLYGNPSELPIKETADLQPTNPYALSKKLAEEACQFYATSLGVKVIILRPFNIYGPNQSDLFLIQSVISQIQKSESIVVKDLLPKRDYIYLDDVTDAIIATLDFDTNYEEFNIGSGRSYSVADLIDIIKKVSNSKLEVISTNERRKDEIEDTIADVRKAKLLLGWEPKTSLDEGISKIINSDY